MKRNPLLKFVCALCFAALLTLAARPAHAYIEVAFTMGKIVGDSTNIMLMQVESVDKVKNTITYKKIEDIKGKHPQDIIKHNIAQAGFAPREWQNVMAWAEVGQYAIMFHNGAASETCINNYWYQCYPGGEWWNMYHGEPYLLRSYAGRPEKLAPLIKQIIEGKEVIVPAMVDGDKNTLHMRTARLQRLKASLKIQEYDAKRDFVGWGGDEIRPISSMPGFTHYAPFSKTSPGAAGSLMADFDGDGKTDFLIYGASRVGLYLTDGAANNEIPLPLTTGARAAAAGHFRNDKMLDIVLATPAGPKLISMLKDAAVRDDSASLPPQAYYNTTAVAALDYDGDGRTDILAVDGFAGLHLYRNITPKDAAKDAPPKFEDVSAKVGLSAISGHKGPGDFILIADVNGDHRPDILYFAETPIVLLNLADGFKPVENSGLAVKSAAVTPALATFDGALHIAIPQPQGATSKIALFRCDNLGHFKDVTPPALASIPGQATSVTFADFDKSGRQDIFVGVLRAPNRFFRSTTAGYVDDSEAIGLTQKIFNTRSLAVLDANRDGTADLLLNNEGQDSLLLIGNPTRKAGAR